MTKTSQEYTLHANFGLVKEAMQPRCNKRFIYFFRKTEEGIPTFDYAEDAEAEMPYLFHVGCCHGNFLINATDIIQNVSLHFIWGKISIPSLLFETWVTNLQPTGIYFDYEIFKHSEKNLHIIH